MLRSGRLSLGPTIDRFEEAIAERVGAPYAAAVSSGTVGLHLLVHIAGIGPGDEVINTPLSIAANNNSFENESANPAWVRWRARMCRCQSVPACSANRVNARANVAALCSLWAT